MSFYSIRLTCDDISALVSDAGIKEPVVIEDPDVVHAGVARDGVPVLHLGPGEEVDLVLVVPIGVAEENDN